MRLLGAAGLNVLLLATFYSVSAAEDGKKTRKEEETRMALGSLDLEGVRYYWRDFVHTALASGGHADPVNLDPMIRKVGTSILRQIHAAVCPSRLNRERLESVANKAARRSIRPVKGREVPSTDYLLVTVASAELVLRHQLTFCQMARPERILLPQ